MIINTSNIQTLKGKAETSTPTAVADGVVVAAWFDEYGRLIVKDQATYDVVTGANKVLESSPISSHHSESTLLDLQDIATNTTAYAYFDMDGFRYFSLYGETSGATPTDTLTVTIQATTQDDGTAMASCYYSDISMSLLNLITGSAGTASWVDTDFLITTNIPVALKWVRVKYVTSNGGGNDADLKVYLKKMY